MTRPLPTLALVALFWQMQLQSREIFPLKLPYLCARRIVLTAQKLTQLASLFLWLFKSRRKKQKIAPKQLNIVLYIPYYLWNVSPVSFFPTEHKVRRRDSESRGEGIEWKLARLHYQKVTVNQSCESWEGFEWKLRRRGGVKLRRRGGVKLGSRGGVKLGSRGGVKARKKGWSES